MATAWGTVAVTEGELVVDRDELRVDKRPRKFLRGQFARLRHGEDRERLRALATIGFFPVAPLLVLLQVHSAVTAPTTASDVITLVGLVVVTVQFWRTYLRPTAIPLSSVEGVRLDPDERELTIAHESGGTPLLQVGSDPGEEQFRLRTAEEAHDARTVLRTRGIEVSGPDQPALVLDY